MKSRETEKKVPTVAPDKTTLDAAFNAIDAWVGHYYQLLFFQNPPLTSPGYEGRPFHVAIHRKHTHCIAMTCNLAPEYSFVVRYFDHETQRAADDECLRRCNLIMTAIRECRKKPDFRACCGLAQTTGCVCTYSYSCELHAPNGQCIGTHD